MQSDDQKSTTSSMTKSNSLDQQTQQISGLSSGVSVAVTLFMGVIAICIGIYITPLIVSIGNNIAQSSGNKFIAFGGVISAVFGPIFPYVLLGVVVTVIIRFSGTIRPVMLTAVALSVATCVFHLYSPMLRQLGERFDAKGLVKSPGGFAVFYCIVGLIVIFVLIVKYGPEQHKKAE